MLGKENNIWIADAAGNPAHMGMSNLLVCGHDRTDPFVNFRMAVGIGHAAGAAMLTAG